MGILIRPADDADADARAEVLVAAGHATYRGLMPDDVVEEITKSRLAESWRRRQLLREPDRRVWMLEVDGVVRAACSTGRTREVDEDARVGEIYSLYAHPDVWNQGLGYRLTDHAVRDLLERFDEVRLWCLATNRRGRAFYERFGFEVAIESDERKFMGYPLPHTRYRLARASREVDPGTR